MRLDRKLFWSYIITILIAISTSFTLFTVTSNQFLSYRLLDSMKKEKHFKSIFSLFMVFSLILNIFPITVSAQGTEVILNQIEEDGASNKSAKASQIISQDTTWNDKVELSENLIINSDLTYLVY